MGIKFDLTKSQSGMHCLSIRDPSDELRQYLLYALRTNFIESPFYQQRVKAHPFLQCDSKDYILIEFWVKDVAVIKRYLDFLEKKYDSTVLRLQQMMY